MNEKISVIIPVYNVEKYIRRCLDSVVNQTYSNLDIILVNDGTPDNSGEILEEYAKKDDRIRVFHNDNMGLSGARNFGIEKIKGEYIAFIDSDDFIELTYFEKLYKTLKENDADISVCGFKLYFENKTKNTKNKNILPYKTRILEKEEAIKNIFSYSSKAIAFTVAWASLAKKELFDGIRYPLNQILEDVSTTYKLYLKASKIAYYNEPLYYYVQRNGSILNSPFTLKKISMINMYDEKLRILSEKNLPEIHNLTLYRYYLMLNFVKLQVKKNKIDYDINIINDKIKKLDTMELDCQVTPKLTLNKILEKYLGKYIIYLYFKFRKIKEKIKC